MFIFVAECISGSPVIYMYEKFVVVLTSAFKHLQCTLVLRSEFKTFHLFSYLLFDEIVFHLNILHIILW